MHEGSSEAFVDELAELAELPRASANNDSGRASASNDSCPAIGWYCMREVHKLALAMAVVQQNFGWYCMREVHKLALAMTIVQQLAGIA